MRKSGMESAWDGFSFLVQKNMRPKGKFFGSDIFTDTEGISFLVPEKT